MQGVDDDDAPPADAPPRKTDVGVRRDHLSAETTRLYASDWGRFLAFCVSRGEGALPAAAATVVAYLEAGGGRAALPRWIAAIDHQHRTRGLAAPGAQAEVRAALRRVRKALPKPVRKAAPGRGALEGMAGRCPGDLAGRRDRAVLLLLAAGVSRRRVVALEAERLRFGEDGLSAPGVTVPRGARPGLCPVRAVEEWLVASGTRYGPVFRKVTRWGTVETQALGADAVRLILQRRTL